MNVVVYDRTIEQKTDKNLKEAKMDIEGQLKDAKTDINQKLNKMDTKLEKVQDTMWAIKNSLAQLENHQQTKKS